MRVSLVALLVKNPPAVQETWVQSLSWEDPLEKGTATHSSILAWKIPVDRGAWEGSSPWGRRDLDTSERLSTQHIHLHICSSLNHDFHNFTSLFVTPLLQAMFTQASNIAPT